MFDSEERVVYRSMGKCPICREWISISDISKTEDTVWHMETKVEHENLRFTQCYNFMMEVGKEQQALLNLRARRLADHFSNYSQDILGL
jgi:ribosomal protein S15P/S13E